MGQVEVFDWLARQRLATDQFFTSREVFKGVDGSSYRVVRACVLKLLDYGFLDVDDSFPRKVRAKKKVSLKYLKA